MKKLKIIVGVLVVMAMMIAGSMLIKPQSLVFASETRAELTESQLIAQAGVFTGQGYYEANQTVVLTATMNKGYNFECWVEVAEDGTETVISTEPNVTIVVNAKTRIKPKVSRQEYEITFANNLWTDAYKTDLKDFTSEVTNQTEGGDKFYYNNKVSVELSIKSDRYIYDLINSNVQIGQSKADFLETNKISGVNTSINNDNLIGFQSIVITFNITEDILSGNSVVVDLTYSYMYTLTLVSKDSAIKMTDIMPFVTVTEGTHEGLLSSDDEKYVYLVKEKVPVEITTLPGNDIYEFKGSQIEGNEESKIVSNSYMLYGNTRFTLNYGKVDYKVEFKTYLINIYGQKDVMDNPIYQVDNKDLKAGQSVNFTYKEDTKQVIINPELEDEKVYNYPSDLYGYEFVGFMIGDELLDDSEYVMSDTTPANAEIQIVFKFIEYQFEIRLVDDYFEDDTEYGYLYNNELSKLIKGTQITVEATTSKYKIKGWSYVSNPTESDYVDIADEKGKQDTYTFVFEPTIDDNSVVNTIYLDVDYQYLTAEYKLKQNSIIKHVDYDIVSVNTTNKTMVFSDSENKVDSKTVVYTQEDVVIDSDVTKISLVDFGEVTIVDGTFSYLVNSIKQTSISREQQDGIDVYRFKKYSYFGSLQLGVVDNIVLTEDGDNVLIALNGKTYTVDQPATDTNLINLTAIKTFDNELNAYKLNCQYDISLYMDGDDYDYIVLRDVKYYFDGDKFVTKNGLINTPEEVLCSTTKSDVYTISLSNLLHNMVLVYSTQTTDETNYAFINHTNQLGSAIWSFEQGLNNVSILNSNSTSEINAGYRQLANNVLLVINNESAYQYENVYFTIQGFEGTTDGVGNVISAKDGDNITITILADKITAGYEFESYMLGESNLTVEDNIYVLNFTMSASVHSNRIININFRPITYTVNVKYIDSLGQIITSNIFGGLKLRGEADFLTTIDVDLTGEYNFELVAEEGYYANNAYVSSEAYILEDLLRNAQTQQSTYWTLNIANFKQAIIDNADANREINIYINFEIHKFSVKVYLEISSNSSVITYPSIYINEIEQIEKSQDEVVDGVLTKVRFVEATGFEYGSNIRFKLDKFMLGTALLQWNDINDVKLADTSTYAINNVKHNVVLSVVLQYVPYMFEFVSVDEQGNLCNYGVATPSNKTFKMYEKVTYTVNVEQGYVLQSKYYYNSFGEIGDSVVDSGFEFIPSRFRIENGTTVKIYLQFALRSVQLNIVNTTQGNKHYFSDIDASEMATFTITRQRGETVDALGQDYIFQTGDLMIMELKTISMGIELYDVQLGGLVGFEPNKIEVVEIKDNEVLIGVYYVVSVRFTPSLIDKLDSDSVFDLTNVLTVKTYKVNYTYNYIDYEFGIKLARWYENNSSATGKTDEPMTPFDLGFGTFLTFGYSAAGLSSGDGAQFLVDGYTIAGLEQTQLDSRGRFTLKMKDASNPDDASYPDNLWEEIAIQQYIAGSNTILVVLNLRPKINLYNFTSYSVEDETYVYSNAIYNGEEQGLVKGVDVEVSGEFDIEVTYEAIGFDGDKPIDVGTYRVTITAIINSAKHDTVYINFNENVIYSIAASTISIRLKTYNSNNPVQKVYGESDERYLSKVAEDIEFVGLFERDKDNVRIDVNQLTIKFTETLVNSMDDLCDIIIANIRLIDKANKEVVNYKLDSGSNKTISKVGKINPAELTLTQITIPNKVYDGTEEVVVNVDDITISGILPGDTGVEFLRQNLKFYVENCNIGEDREVFLDWSTALIGPDSSNYTIVPPKMTIDIHPYELTYHLAGYGIFKVVDIDRKALIPIDSRIIARSYERGSAEYRQAYSWIEGQISQGEKFTECFKVVIQVDGVNLKVPSGLYVYMPKVNKVTKVIQVPNNDMYFNLEYAQEANFIVVKVQQGEALFGITARTTYLPLWAIILIVIGSLILIAIMVFIFILIRRRTKNKYSSYDKI